MRSTLKPRYDGVKTGSLNQAVKRNMDRFPEDFMFRLTEEEWEHLLQSGMISQIVTSHLSKRKKSSPPFAFTEHGAVMLASVLHSPSAVQMSVMVTRAFIAMRQAISTMLSINDALDQLRDTKVTPRKPIGFKTQKNDK